MAYDDCLQRYVERNPGRFDAWKFLEEEFGVEVDELERGSPGSSRSYV